MLKTIRVCIFSTFPPLPMLRRKGKWVQRLGLKLIDLGLASISALHLMPELRNTLRAIIAATVLCIYIENMYSTLS